jgi:hypothetical protein
MFAQRFSSLLVIIYYEIRITTRGWGREVGHAMPFAFPVAWNFYVFVNKIPVMLRWFDCGKSSFLTFFLLASLNFPAEVKAHIRIFSPPSRLVF